jgi:hypothetical protein
MEAAISSETLVTFHENICRPISEDTALINHNLTYAICFRVNYECIFTFTYLFIDFRKYYMLLLIFNL